MTTKQLNYKALPIIAAADGATSPALTANDKGAMAFSTMTNKPMSWDGTRWNLLTKVDSVAGRTGAVTLTKTDVGLGSVDNVSAASLRDRTTHTGEQAISTVTGLQTALNGKATTGHSHSDVTTTSNGFMTSADKVKLDGIVPANLLSRANHTGTQAISTIDTLQSTLDTKASTGHSHTEATTSANGFMSSADKVKLDGIVTANLVNRANHTGEQAISTITGLQAAIDGRASSGHTHADATSSVGGFMSRTDKAKLDALNSATLLDRANHTGAQAIATVTGLQAALDGKAATTHTHAVATSSVAGFMSNTDKAKLDGIAAGANNYAHPANHPASIITQDANNRFVTDAEKAVWNAKLGSVKTINGQSIVGTGDLVVAGSSTFATDITVNNITVGRGAGNSSENTAIGFEALSSNINGVQNTAAGRWSMQTNTSGSYNTAYGVESLQNNTVGSQNTAVGQGALRSNSIGGDNVACGALALSSSTEGQSNVAIGVNALKSFQLGSFNVAVGFSALENYIGYGNSNTAIGAYTLQASVQSEGNTAVGESSMRETTSGSMNTAIGTYSLISNTTGSYNVALGYTASAANVAGESNIAIGFAALTSNQSGSGNIAIGSSSLANQKGTGSIAIGSSSLKNFNGIYQNIAIGPFSMDSCTTGGNNIAIGTETLKNTNSRFNVAIGGGAGRNVSGERNTALGDYALANTVCSGKNNIALGPSSLNQITSGSGNISIGGVRSDSLKWTSDEVFKITTENDRISMGSTAVTNAYIQVAWTVVSDARDKTNFAAIPHGLDFVKQLKPTAYQFRQSRESEETNGGVRYGFKAQDIAAIEPEGVIVDTTNPEKLYYNESNLIPVLVKAIQELSAEVERLKAGL